MLRRLWLASIVAVLFFWLGVFVTRSGKGFRKKIPADKVFFTGPKKDAARRVSFSGPAGGSVKRNNAIVQAINKASRSVVFIGVTQIQVYSNPFFNDPFFRKFFPPSVREYKSMGSGVIISKKGYVVTNFHVIQNASKIEVHLTDGKKYIAKRVGADPFTDLAIIKIEGADFPAIEMCPNDSLYIGEWSIAIGNPFGALIKGSQPTVTMGVISAYDREFTRESGVGGEYKKMIQTDAAINPGNSGGALINAYGELIGINTFIFSQGSGGSVGIGFAIPVKRVRKTFKEILQYGKIRSFFTGISIQNLDRAIAQSLGLKTTNGVIINGIEKKSPGKKAGLKPGDVIIQVDDYEIFGGQTITDVFNQFLPGDTVSLKVLRGTRKKEFALILETRE